VPILGDNRHLRNHRAARGRNKNGGAMPKWHAFQGLHRPPANPSASHAGTACATLPPMRKRCRPFITNPWTETAMILQVEGGVGPHGDVEPRAFVLGGRRIDIDRIIDRWLSSSYGYFKVATSDEARFILRHDTASVSCELTLFQAPGVAR